MTNQQELRAELIQIQTEVRQLKTEIKRLQGVGRLKTEIERLQGVVRMLRARNVLWHGGSTESIMDYHAETERLLCGGDVGDSR